MDGNGLELIAYDYDVFLLARHGGVSCWAKFGEVVISSGDRVGFPRREKGFRNPHSKNFTEELSNIKFMRQVVYSYMLKHCPEEQQIHDVMSSY